MSLGPRTKSRSSPLASVHQECDKVASKRGAHCVCGPGLCRYSIQALVRSDTTHTTHRTQTKRCSVCVDNIHGQAHRHTTHTTHEMLSSRSVYVFAICAISCVLRASTAKSSYRHQTKN